ncbi:Abi family protein [Veillonella caviae]|uniref:Abi family protein n=1 Tax=Veillonella caviae TaxID=248316 RepID=UPI0023A80ADD|nr:Abi family protein [Veillonella caviae]MCI5708039.1 Abi family protein [Veillonella caviae]MDY5715852.1 Abi family protein [Veillonella caviae]
MSIKSFVSRTDLIDKLKSRGLIFDEIELNRALVKQNYYSLFNGFENLLLETLNPKSYKNTTLDDFKALYFFDKNFSSIIFSSLNKVEESLKTSIAYHFTKIHCATLNETMQYTNKDNYMNPQDSNKLSKTYCPYSKNYPFVNEQNKKIYSDFSNFCLFKPYYLTNLINWNDHIDVKFYQSDQYMAPKDVAIYRDAKKNEHRDVAVPFWVAIETLTFGEIIRLLHYLQDDVLEDVLNDFNLKKSKRSEFLNMMDFLLCLRNSCAHGTLINRFTTPISYKVNANIVTSFLLKPQKHYGYQYSKLSLFDILKILSYFEPLKELKRLLKRFFYSNYRRMGYTAGNQLNQKLLKRMGCSDYSQWKALLSGKMQYTL